MGIKRNNGTDIPSWAGPQETFDPPASGSGGRQQGSGPGDREGGRSQRPQLLGGLSLALEDWHSVCGELFLTWTAAGVTDVQKTEMLTPEGLWTTWFQLQFCH